MDQRYILSFYVNEQLKMVLQNNGEITDSPPAFAGASCERDSTRQNGNTWTKGWLFGPLPWPYRPPAKKKKLGATLFDKDILKKNSADSISPVLR